MINKLFVCVFVAVAMLMAGCSSYYEIDIKGDKHPDWNPRKGLTYHLIPMDEKIKRDTPEFIWYAKYIRYCLKKDGYVEIDSREQADLIIALFYHVTTPRERMYVHSYNGNMSSYYVTTCARGLALVGYATLDASGRKNVWSVSAASVGRSDDLKAIFPFLVFASKQYWGTQLDGTVYVKIDVDSEDVKQFSLQVNDKTLPAPAFVSKE